MAEAPPRVCCTGVMTMRRSNLLYFGTALASVLVAGTLMLAPIASADPVPPLKKSSPTVKGPIVKGPIVKGPIVKGPVKGPIVKGPIVKGPIVKPLPPPKKGPPPKGGGKTWVRPYVLPPIGYWIWGSTRINSYDYDGCGYEYYKWKSTGSSYWRRMYRECREWD